MKLLLLFAVQVLNCQTYFRYITRTVLIPFTSSDATVSVLDQMEADKRLKAACVKAQTAVSLATQLELNDEVGLRQILEKLQELLPASTPQRLYISYGWLIQCTKQVSWHVTLCVVTILII